MFSFLRLAFVIIHLFLVLRNSIEKWSIKSYYLCFFWKYRYSDLIKLKVAVPQIGEGMCGFYLWFLVQDCSCKIIISLIISMRDRSKFFLSPNPNTSTIKVSRSSMIVPLYSVVKRQE